VLRFWPLGVLAALLVLFVAGAGMGFANQGGGGGIHQGPVDALSGLLIRPAAAADLRPRAAACGGAGGTLTVAPGATCVYDLRTGFLASRLRLRQTAGGPATAVVTQPDPSVTDSKRLAPGEAAEFVYRQSGSVLRVTCPRPPAGACTIAPA
jgi:hypothetical protein